MAARPLSVSKPGSPGPAPTRYTWVSPSNAPCHAPRPIGVRRQTARRAARERVLGGLAAHDLGLRPRALHPHHARPVQAAHHAREPDHVADAHGQARRWAFGSRLRAPPGTLRSARAARSDSAWFTARTSAATSSRSAATSTAMTPWPAAGMTTSGARYSVMRSLHPRRATPATARTMPAMPSSSCSLRQRVARLPRMLTHSTSGRTRYTCAARRRLDVPTRAPSGSSASARPSLPRNASRGSWRWQYAPISKAVGQRRWAGPSGCARPNRGFRRAGPSRSRP